VSTELLPRNGYCTVALLHNESACHNTLLLESVRVIVEVKAHGNGNGVAAWTALANSSAALCLSTLTLLPTFPLEN
jgi:hypothetical protein